jgi:hypothetical protein
MPIGRYGASIFIAFSALALDRLDGPVPRAVDDEVVVAVGVGAPDEHALADVPSAPVVKGG